MSGPQLLPVLLLLCSLWQISAQSSFLAPHGSYEQVFQYSDGQISVNQTMQLRLAESLSSGNLQVGGYKLAVQSLPPDLTFRARTIGMIPKTATLHTEEVCLVSNEQAFQRAEALAKQKMEELQAQANSGRRLLSYQQHMDMLTDIDFYSEHCNDINWQDVTGAVLDSFNRDPEHNRWWWPTYPVWNDQLRWIRSQHHGRSWPPQLASVMPLLEGITHFGVHNVDKCALFAKHFLKYLHAKYHDAAWEGKRFFDGNPDHFDRNEFYFVLRWEYVVTGVERGVKFLRCYAHPGRCFVSGLNLKGEELESCNQWMRESPLGGGSPFGMPSLISDQFNAVQWALGNSTHAQLSWNNKTEAWINKTSVQLDWLTEGIHNQSIINDNIADLFDRTRYIDKQFQDFNNKTTTQLDFLYNLQTTTTEIIHSRLRNQFDLISDVRDNTSVMFQHTADAMQDITQLQTAQFTHLYSSLSSISDSIQALSAVFESYMKKKQFNRLLTQRFYSSLDALSSSSVSEFPLISGDGVRPSLLSGDDLRAPLDNVILRYTRDDGASVVLAMAFFLDTQDMLLLGRA